MIELTASYVRAVTRHNIVAGSTLAKRISIVVRALSEAESLPLEGDDKMLLPPVEWVWSHHVPATGYHVVYSFTEEKLALRTLRLAPVQPPPKPPRP